MQAEYVMKVQVINSKRRQPRFFVNIPLPLVLLFFNTLTYCACI
jgi:hypothetical protein